MWLSRFRHIFCDSLKFWAITKIYTSKWVRIPPGSSRGLYKSYLRVLELKKGPKRGPNIERVKERAQYCTVLYCTVLHDAGHASPHHPLCRHHPELPIFPAWARQPSGGEQGLSGYYLYNSLQSISRSSKLQFTVYRSPTVLACSLKCAVSQLRWPS